MLRSWLSITGIYDYDNSIFDNFHLPDGIEKTLVTSRILIDCAELEILFPDPPFLKKAISYWSRSRMGVWQKLWDTLNLQYNPIHNRYIDYSEAEHIITDDDKTGSESVTTHSDNNQSATDNNQQNVAAFDSNTLQPRQSSDTDSTAEAHRDGSGNRQYGEGKTGDIQRTLNKNEEGNTGYTMPQAMIKAERELALLDIYNTIVNDFKKQFCLCVY